MTFSLAEFKIELQYLYDQAKTGTGVGSWSSAYEVLFGLISVDDQGRAILSHASDGSIVDRNGTAVNLDSFALSDADEAAANPALGVDPAAWVFLRGVSDVNAGIGDFSTFIREYSKTQYIMRFGEGTKTPEELDAVVQATSNKIAEFILRDILDLNPDPDIRNPNHILSTADDIAKNDAQAAAETLFGSSEIAGWAGNPLFIFLGVDGPFRTNILHETPTGEISSHDAGDILSVIAALKAAAVALGIEPSIDLFSQVLFHIIPDADAYNLGLAEIVQDTDQFISDTYGPSLGDIIFSNIQVDLTSRGSTLQGMSDDDVIYAGGGDDTVTGNRGDDLLDGGQGNDRLFGGFGQDKVFGNEGDDTLFAAANEDQTNLEADQYDGGEGYDTLTYDPVTGFGVAATINGNDGTAFKNGEQFPLPLFDIDQFTSIENLILTGQDDAIAVTGDAFITVDAGAGNDTADFTAYTNGGIFLSTWDGTVYAAGAALQNVETFKLTNSDDTITLNTTSNIVIDGGVGNDTLHTMGEMSFIDGEGIYLGNTAPAEVSSDTVVLNVETVNVISGRGYFEIADLGYNFDSHDSFDALSFQAHEGSLTFSFDYAVEAGEMFSSAQYAVSDGVQTDRIGWSSVLIGTNSGDTFSYFVPGTPPSVRVQPNMIFSGSGDDTFNLDPSEVGSAVFYGGGNDILSPNSQYLIMPIGVEASDLSIEFLNRTQYFRDTPWNPNSIEYFLHDITVSIAGYETVSYKQVELDSVGGISFLIQTAEGVRTASFAWNTDDNNEPVLLYGSTAYVIPSEGGAADPAAARFGGVYHGTLGNDTISLVDYYGYNDFNGYDGDDVAMGDVDANTIHGGVGNDTLSGMGGNDWLYGGSGNDTISGGDGNDTIFGGTGDDRITGGQGNDTLDGGLGNDTYVFHAGDGVDIITDAGGNDTLLLGPGITIENLDFGRAGNDLVITIASGVVIKDFFTGVNNEISANTIESITFDNGSVLTAQNISEFFANKPPVAADDDVDAQFLPYTFGNVLDNDSDPDGDQLTVVEQLNLTTINGGHVTLFSGGFFFYEAPVGFTGTTDSFEYTVMDPGGLTSTATVHAFNIKGNLNHPIAEDDIFEAAGLTTFAGNVLDNDLEPDGDDLFSFVFEEVTVNGGTIVSDNFGNFTYTAAEGFTGTDSFEYVAYDGLGGFDFATVTINGLGEDLTAIEIPPVVIIDATQSDSFAGNLLDNVVSTSPLQAVAGIFATASGGTVDIAADGSFIYQAADGFRGSDSFEYTITNDAGGSVTGTITLNDVFTNRAPDAAGDSFTANEDTVLTGNVMDNDSDPDGDAMTVTAGTIVTAHGSVELAANGSFTYTAAENYNGADSFDYTVTDEYGASSTATASITLNAVNDAPIAANDSFIMDKKTTLTGNVLANDTDPDGDTLRVIETSVTTAQGFTVILAANGDFTFTPPANFSGTDSFTYSVADDAGGQSTATVSLTVLPPQGTGGGTDGDDVIVGDSGKDVIFGHDGDDILSGGAGKDRLIGGAGDDILIGGDGKDKLNGGAGDDTYIVNDHGDKIKDSSGIDTVQSSVSWELERNLENLTLTGTGNIDGEGNKLDNVMTGNSGNNILYGNKGNDTLIGGAGADTLIGGRGADIFVFDDLTFSGKDTVEDFSGKEGDVLDISTILTSFDPDSHRLTDFVMVTNHKGDSILSIDRDGTGTDYGWTQVAVIEDTRLSTNEEQLVSSGILIV